LLKLFKVLWLNHGNWLVFKWQLSLYFNTLLFFTKSNRNIEMFMFEWFKYDIDEVVWKYFLFLLCMYTKPGLEYYFLRFTAWRLRIYEIVENLNLFVNFIEIGNIDVTRRNHSFRSNFKHVWLIAYQYQSFGDLRLY